VKVNDEASSFKPNLSIEDFSFLTSEQTSFLIRNESEMYDFSIGKKTAQLLLIEFLRKNWSLNAYIYYLISKNKSAVGQTKSTSYDLKMKIDEIIIPYVNKYIMGAFLLKDFHALDKEDEWKEIKEYLEKEDDE
jgi:hypothetical protein